MDKNIKKQIIELIYNTLDYMYCDNCRFGSEIDSDTVPESGCEDCYRKYNGWGISKKESTELTENIIKILEGSKNE